MAVIVYAPDPPTLLLAIRSAINEGRVETWSVDSDGDFTHNPPQWNRKAWLRAKISDDRIVFRIFPPLNTTMTKTTYAVYHGRFIEMLLNHFDTKIHRAVATALPAEGDRVKT